MSDIHSIIKLLEHQKTAIDDALVPLREISGEAPVKRRGGPPGSGTKKRGMTAEGRQRQIAAMRRYWAARRAGLTASTNKATKKRGLTAAGRKALSDNMKRMWAERRLGKNKVGR